MFFPQYLVMFNNLVEDWVTEGLGISYAELVGRRRIGLPTVSLNCEFIAVSNMGDEVALGLSVERIGTSSIRLALGCHHGPEERVRVLQVLVTTNLDTHRAIPIPADLRDAMAKFQSR